MLRLDRNPHGPRLYLCGLRVHHGLSGLVLAAIGACVHSRALVAVGTLALADDWRDFPFPLRDPVTPR